MTRKEKCELAIELGFKYNQSTGEVTGSRGKVITAKSKGYIYLQLKLDKKMYQLRAHQFAWYTICGEIVEQIDHVNGIKYDNRISNLRSVTNQQNQWNRTKALGYSCNKLTNKWNAKISVDGKTINLGSFIIESEARQAYLDAKEKYHIIK